MSGSHIIDYWEDGIGRMPPDEFQTIVDKDEKLLWAVRARSETFMQPNLFLALFLATLGFLFLLGAPWGESMSDFCGLKSASSCRKFYVMAWPGILACAVGSIMCFSIAFKSATAPWQLSYAISTKRAFLVDWRKPTKPRTVNLDQYEPRLGSFGSVIFGTARFPILAFAQLGEGPASKAIYWATEGRKKQITLSGGT